MRAGLKKHNDDVVLLLNPLLIPNMLPCDPFIHSFTTVNHSNRNDIMRARGLYLLLIYGTHIIQSGATRFDQESQKTQNPFRPLNKVPQVPQRPFAKMESGLVTPTVSKPGLSVSGVPARPASQTISQRPKPILRAC